MMENQPVETYLLAFAAAFLRRPQDGNCMRPLKDKDTWRWLRMLQEVLEASCGLVSGLVERD